MATVEIVTLRLSPELSEAERAAFALEKEIADRLGVHGMEERAIFLKNMTVRRGIPSAKCLPPEERTGE